MTELDRTTLDLLPEAVVVVDRDRAVTAWNDRATTLLGLTDDALGEPVEKVLDLRDDSGEPAGPALLAPGAIGDRLPERTLRLVLPDGHRRVVALSVRIHPSGAVLSFRSAGRRERVDRARSDLVATVSHEIRSPLTSVKGFTRTMLTRWERFTDEQKRTMLETINEDADRVTRLLSELLDVSRIDAGRVELHRQLVDVAAVAAVVVAKAEHRPDGSGRRLTVESSPDRPPVWADPDKLEQVLTNLVDNALRYAPDSPVTIRVAASNPEGAHLHVQVADDGPGIARDQLRRIFEKFGRGRGSRRSGTGLGLYISRGLVAAHGGRIWCESEPGEGAVFHVLLPAGAPGVPPAE